MASSEWSVQFRQFWVTTASIYVVEMAVFFIALFLYHHCFFIPRVRLKMYKVPQDEASHSLMRISGMLNDHVDKTQQDDLVDHLHHREDDTQRELSDETSSQQQHGMRRKSSGGADRKMRTGMMSANTTQTSYDSPFLMSEEKMGSATTTAQFESMGSSPIPKAEMMTPPSSEPSLKRPKFDYEKPLPEGPPPSIRLY